MRDISQLNAVLPKPRPTFVPGGSLLTVTIGRNIGTLPMDDHRWEAFQLLVRASIRDFFQPSAQYGPFYGRGEWDGVTEESVTFTATTHYPGSVDMFGKILSDLARDFGQDAIAWTFGPAFLAEAAPIETSA